MNQQLSPKPLGGTVAAIASKSMAHRLLICAALAGTPDSVVCRTTSKDMEATRACLQAMAAHTGLLPCGESGSTLRFLLPVAAALGLEADFSMEGRLPQRPLDPLDRQLQTHGITLTRPQPQILRISGQLQPGSYSLPGNISSQYISGLLFALPLLDGPSTLTVTGPVESEPYIRMTLAALAQFGVRVEQTGNVYHIAPQTYRSPGTVTVEGDWSNAAFWLCAGALGQPVTVTGLDPDSLQGDRAITDLLRQFGARVLQEADRVTVSPGTLRPVTIDAAAIPDLVPIVSVVAAAAPGTTRIFGAQRLRLKESDRLETVCAMLQALGAHAEQTEDGLLIHGGKGLSGGTAHSANDHRIAMSAAIAAIICAGPVTITGAEAVEKSYPHFWSDYEALRVSPQ